MRLNSAACPYGDSTGDFNKRADHAVRTNAALGEVDIIPDNSPCLYRDVIAESRCRIDSEDFWPDHLNHTVSFSGCNNVLQAGTNAMANLWDASFR